jgi:hypothetical protein
MLKSPGSPTLLEDVVAAGRLLWRLPAYFRHPITLQEARETLRRRLERREVDFLLLAKQAIYANAASPYRALLRLVGCEEGDLNRLVDQEGIEGALRNLYRQGVYLTADEFKGRRPVVRGSASITVESSQLRNPRSVFYLWGQTSGSRGTRTWVPHDLARARDDAVNTQLTLDARGGADWVKAVWGASTGSLGVAIRFSGFGAPTARSFALVDPATPGLHPRYRWSARALRVASVLSRIPLPRLEHVPIDHPLPIAHWMARVLQSGRVPHLWAFVSPAVRLCEAAFDAGIDIQGAQFTVTGEPVTAPRLAAIRGVGAEGVVDYGSAESGPIGHGCLAPETPDDVHVFHDLHALIQPEAEGTVQPLPPDALVISSLRPTAPLILLNVSMGDLAERSERACGCPLQQLGWSTHLHTIRSFEKLTAGGMTFLGADIVPVLEETLPARFGGGPTDYQLVEEETPEGRSRLRLLVHPAVGPLNEDTVADAFLTAIGRGSGAERVMALHWRQAGLVHVERRPPLVTLSGKILHIHLDRSRAARCD